jgi:hypothetical protein
MPPPIDYLTSGPQTRNLGARPFSEFEDPTQIRNPYYAELDAMNSDLRTRRAQADAAEFAASPERQRTQRTQDQLDSDYDLEYRAPSRVDLMGALDRKKARQGADIYFDPDVTAQRENERGFKREQFEAQYGDAADSRRLAALYGMQGRIGAAEAQAGGRTDSARITTQGRVRGQMVDDMGKVDPSNQPRVDAIDRNLGVMGDKPFPMAKFRAFALQEFGGDEAAAEEALAREGYYLSEN